MSSTVVAIDPPPRRHLSLPSGQSTRNTSSLSRIQAAAQRNVLSFLGGLRGGSIRYSDAWHLDSFGDSATSELQADWHIRHPKFYSRLAADGSLGFAESYLEGHWQTDNLTTLLRLLYRNLPSDGFRPSGLSGWVRSLLFRLRPNTLTRSRRRIAAHYDLSNEFFELFLDPTLMYSAGWFESPHSTLHEASIAKLDRICQRLDLKPSDNVLEIGSGWGGFALHAAQNVGCHVTTTTISDAQHRKAEQRFHQSGFADRITLLNRDYRDLQGRFSKVVSIEMIEAVGERHMDTYFRQCARLLKPGGRLVIQAIVMPEERYPAYRRSVDFIQQYIFPGGFLPSVAAIQEAVGRTSSLRLNNIEDLSDHYARTLAAWRKRFTARLDSVRQLGFDERFIRMWEYYLCYCEAAFREQAVRVVQIAWDRPPTVRNP